MSVLFTFPFYRLVVLLRGMFLLFFLLSVLVACGVVGCFTRHEEPYDIVKASGHGAVVAAPTGSETIAVAPDCPESLGLVSALIADGDGSYAHWDCTNYTGYTDSRGRKVGGNCDGAVRYGGGVECECMPVVDPVTGKRRPTTRVAVQDVQLCVPDADLYEAD